MKILVAGDFCQAGRARKVFFSNPENIISSDISDLIKNVDIAAVNFEFPIISTLSPNPIKKRGPHLYGDLSAIQVLKNAGFNFCTLANNHILDQGAECCLFTQKILEDSGFDTVGVGQNSIEASQFKIIHKKNESVAIINCCEHEFSIATHKTAGANPINAIQIYYSIQKAKSLADYVIVIVHGGIEHYQLPTPRMKELYRFFIDAGADAVLNHHQHCYSGYEMYKNKFIFYGLGNFLFDWEGKRHGIWNEGFFVVLELSHANLSFVLYPYTQCNEDVKVELMSTKEKDLFESRIMNLNSIIADDGQLQAFHEQYMCQNAGIYKQVLQPYQGRIMKGLYNRGFLPNLISESHRLGFINYIECESHVEQLLFTLKLMKK